ncbi:MAG: DUF2784 domain-containing protein [bacterium]|nr:DUF2784 domain-containing protein [bacterium]
MGRLADLVLVLHAGFVAFVVVGQLLILAGLALKWRWVRGFRFRLVHLAAILFVTAQTWAGLPCPLTALENRLRVQAGQAGYDEGFIAHHLHGLIFHDASPRTFALAYTGFGLLVVLTWVLGRPSRPGR